MKLIRATALRTSTRSRKIVQGIDADCLEIPFNRPPIPSDQFCDLPYFPEDLSPKKCSLYFSMNLFHT